MRCDGFQRLFLQLFKWKKKSPQWGAYTHIDIGIERCTHDIFIAKLYIL